MTVADLRLHGYRAFKPVKRNQIHPGSYQAGRLEVAIFSNHNNVAVRVKLNHVKRTP